MSISTLSGRNKSNKFIDLLIRQSDITAKGLNILETCIHDLTEESIEKVRQKEYEGDEVRRILIDELLKTFITPLDREDIYNISQHIDEMLDYAHSTIKEMVLLEVVSDQYLETMITLNRKAAEEMAVAMLRLQENPMVALEHARRARKLESEVEQVYREAIADLFTKAKNFKQVMEYLRRREVYRHVSNMADQADAAAHTLGMVVIKMT
jgi:predicted phosphate transport protein (TIGR00153 family)